MGLANPFPVNSHSLINMDLCTILANVPLVSLVLYVHISESIHCPWHKLRETKDSIADEFSMGLPEKYRVSFFLSSVDHDFC